ncbi:MAG: PIN domain-containing protein [Candidatus Verstraetearchaeota archaeon]|nr:PIN domain-containing protein [Candidatus Verstraetearchaeota archaeon]
MVERLVLDTTYLLPLFGVDVGLKGFAECFPRVLDGFEVWFNPMSLVEAKWIVLRLLRRDPSRRGVLLLRFRRGLEALKLDERFRQTVLTSAAVEEVADRLLEVGVGDYFDRLIYATAVCYDAVLLTEDEELRRTAELDGAPRLKGVVCWEELLKEL